MTAARKRPATPKTHKPSKPASRSVESTGNWNPDWESFAMLDPAWTSKVVAVAMTPAVSGALEPKTMELIGVALAASCSRLNAKLLRRHMRRALDLGASRAEITAVLQLVSLEGLTSLCVGAPILVEELAATGRPFASPISTL
ncbi:MAG TPA: carboxymuconolactone decarboxylase family protein [Usitatibacter sp.]|jgi:alkylhydroperoxidase/carboxymuconolactone decarboxylase family protein YurZ|nr:carboxymuconolactone decarboxylase family protein [Usitatibacter sp.]